MTNRKKQSGVRTHVAQFLAGFLVLFAAGDWLIAQFRLPLLTAGGNEVRSKWEMYRDRSVTPDVVILGSSYEEFGVNPAVLDEQVGERLGREVSTMNLAAPASSPNTEYLVVRELLKGDDLPKIAYLGITPYAVDVGQRGWVRNGLKVFGNHHDLLACWSVDWMTFRETLIASVFRSYAQWSDLRLMMERFVLAANWDDGAESRPDAQGWRTWRGKRRPQVMRFEPASTLLDLETLGAGRFGSDTINGRRVREAIAALRERGVTVRLLELPHASTSLAESDPKKNHAYRAFVDDLIADTGVSLVRPQEGLLVDADYFDDGHLLAVGAAKLSRWLARDTARALANHGNRVQDASGL